MIYKYLVQSIIMVLVVGCATSPTGRKQLIIMPEAQMSVMGAQAFDQMKEQTPVYKDPAWNNYVRCVALPITESAKGELEVKNWEIVVFKDDTANAFALPGGKIGVHTGILSVAKTDAQLAAVLGHEVGHVIAKHGNERVSEAFATEGGLAAIGALTRDNPNTKTIMGLLGVGTQLGVLLPHSRTQESEADVIGLDLMSRAGFDPKGSVELWKNMMEASKGAPPEFLSTHPASEKRIENLQSHMDESLAKYQKANTEGKKPNCRRPAGV